MARHQARNASRREMLSLAAASLGVPFARAAESSPPASTLGVILYPWEIEGMKWPHRAAETGITTIAFHAARRLDVLVDFVNRDEGAAFLEEARTAGVEIEYELHAFSDLLSRELYYEDDSMFRLDRNGRRNPDKNCCPSSIDALDEIARKAVSYGRILRPTTERYFYWSDDGSSAGAWCSCPKCEDLSPCDQATLVENHIVAALQREISPEATLSHLAYQTSLTPPTTVRPHEGLFLEFAPIRRSFQHPISDNQFRLEEKKGVPPTNRGYLDFLDQNLTLFPAETAQILEYYLDVSLIARWKRPAQKLELDEAIMEADAKIYHERGIRHISSFALWLDRDYRENFGEPPIREYSEAFRSFSDL